VTSAIRPVFAQDHLCTQSSSHNTSRSSSKQQPSIYSFVAIPTPAPTMAVLKGTELGFHHRGINLVIITLIFSALATVLVVGRVISRLKSGRKLHADDYIIIVSLVSCIQLYL
jgi:hypothetical protein